MAEKKLSKIGEIKKTISGTLRFPGEDKKGFDKDFYQDVDRVKNKSCCSLPVVIVILVLIFGLLVYGMFWLKNYAHLGVRYFALEHSQNQKDLTEGFVEKTMSMQPGENLLMDFSEVEVSQYLGIADPDFPIKKAKLRIDDQAIKISGRLSDSFFALPVEFQIRPKIDNNKLTFVLDDVSASSVSMPKFVKDKINSYLDLIMRSKSLYDETLEIISANCTDQKLVIEVHKK